MIYDFWKTRLKSLPWHYRGTTHYVTEIRVRADTLEEATNSLEESLIAAKHAIQANKALLDMRIAQNRNALNQYSNLD